MTATVFETAYDTWGPCCDACADTLAGINDVCPDSITVGADECCTRCRRTFAAAALTAVLEILDGGAL